MENDVSKNRLGDAEKIVIKAAKTNGKELDTPIFVAEEDKNDDVPKKNACSDFLAMFGDIWNVISGKTLILINFIGYVDDGDRTLTQSLRDIGDQFKMLMSDISHRKNRQPNDAVTNNIKLLSS